MTHSYLRKPTLLLFWVLLLGGFWSWQPAHAQKENYNWYFGNRAALSFQSGEPVAVSGSALYSYEGSASISDAAGNLLFYTNGEEVWNRNHARMPNGAGLGGHNSASQVAAIVPRPGSSTLYYVFVVFATR